MSDSSGLQHDDSPTKAVIVDYTSTPDIRASLIALGVDPDDEAISLSEGSYPGHLWRIRILGAVLDPGSDSPSDYVQIELGGTEGGLELAVKDVFDALDGYTTHPEDNVEHRLEGSAEAFDVAIATPGA
jgi:hypothetical protein